MDNLAHSLVGLVASKAGLERLSPGATGVCIVTANAADLDFISALSGDRWTVLHYHRGVTHSIVGTLVLSLIIPALFYLGDALIARARGRPLRLRFAGLLLAALVAGATHPLLDWTNNYGVRLLLPWNGKWFYGDLVFVIDPVLWLVFGGAAFLLTSQTKLRLLLWSLLASILSLLIAYAVIIRRVLDHPGSFMARWVIVLIGLVICYKLSLGRLYKVRVAVVAFVLLFGYWGFLGVWHARALARAESEGAALATQNHERVVQFAAMPTLAKPNRWRCVVETDKAFYRFDVLVGADPEAYDLVRYAKPDSAEARLAMAKRDRTAQMFFEFARFPVARVVGDCATQTLVQFADLRYTEPGKSMGNFSLELPIDCPPTTVEASNGR